MTKNNKSMGVQQILLYPNDETKALLDYLCQQSGKLYNTGVYFARQVFFKTGKLLVGKFDLVYENSISKSMLMASLPSIPAQQTLMSVAEAFKSFKELHSLFLKGQLHFKPKAPDYLKGSKLFKVIERGLYRSKDGSVVNADLNGSANILRKVASNLGIDLGLLSRWSLTTVARIRLWVLPKSILSAESQP